MYALRVRQEGERSSGAVNSVASGGGGGASAAQERTSREGERERKRREAELRQQRSKVLKPLKDRIAAVETKIEAAEVAHRATTELLSDPTVYADTKRRGELLAKFDEQKAELAKLTSEWEALGLELEAKETALER
jgi:ATP-binding cassette subfamily F protein 3